jgi:predicted nucleic acid-binding protein
VRRYLLDTPLVSAFLQGRPVAVSLIDPWVKAGEAAMSALVYAEVVEYLAGRSDFAQAQRQLQRVLLDIFPYFLTLPILDRYATIRRQLRPPHGPGLIGDIDTLIAATAIEKGLTLVTTDSDFSRVSQLSLRVVPRSRLRA